MEAPLSKAEIDTLIALYGQGKLAELIAIGEPLVQRHPQLAVLHNILGAANAGLKRGDAAVDCFRNALRINPHAAEAHNNLGNALKTLGRHEEAMDCYRRALSIQPGNPQIHNNLANGLRATGRIDEAIAGYEHALRLEPHYAEAIYNLSVTLRAVGRRDEAVDCCLRALRIKPDYAEVHDNLGLTLRELGHRDEAVACFRTALRLKPDLVSAHLNLGNALKDMGRRDEAIDSYSQALAVQPDHAVARAQRLHQQATICDWEAIAADRHLIPELGILGDSVSPFTMLSLEDAPSRHRIRAERYVADLHRKVNRPVFARPGARPERLRIGYFSADFHNHAAMFLMARMFELHDRERFEVRAYSFGPDKDDEMRRRARAGFEHFHDVRAMDDRAVARLAREHGLDVAVDLMGHTHNARLGIFAEGAAPVQIAYMGYPSSLGAPFIDYLIADKLVVPAERRDDYSESLIYLPDTYWATDDRMVMSQTPSTRSAFGLPDRAFVFGSFNNSFKITAEEFTIWMRLLARVEGSVLWLLAMNPWAEASLRRRAAAAGLASERLIFAKPMPHAEHVARQRHADLFLDSFNYNGHTTASDALWAGLPVLTRMGQSFPARVAGSILNSIGLPELVTTTSEDYEALAFALASDPGRMRQIREKLARNRMTTPLFDSARFTRSMESAFDRADALYRSGEAPHDLDMG
jgi:predicted O-linked N-acetylglucosamine transferase (SPINDLY family)